MKEKIFDKRYIPPIISAAFLTALFIKNSSFAVTSVMRGTEKCMTTLIPSLFPFMVLSSIFIECDVVSLLGRLLGKRSEKLFGISAKALAAVLSGLLFGFPIGVLALISLYDRNEISNSELSRSIGFCGIPSFGFTVNTVGISLFADKSFGLFMYFSSLLAALISGFAFNRGKKDSYINYIPPTSKIKKTSEIITNAVITSAKAVFTLCAYVLFFSCICDCLTETLTGSPQISAVFGSLLELTCGVFACSNTSGYLKYAICGFTIGWSGLSVHLQTVALLKNRVEKYSIYFYQKAFQGLLCSFAALLFYIFE